MPPRRPAAFRSSRKRKEAPASSSTAETSPEPGGEEFHAVDQGVSQTVGSGAGAAAAGSRTVLSPPLSGGKNAQQPAKRARVEFDAEAYAAAMELVKTG